jgi:hypothetical protein
VDALAERRDGDALAPPLVRADEAEQGPRQRKPRAGREDEARDLAKRALQFKKERGRLPDINSADAWEKRMAEGVAAFARYVAQIKAAQAQGESGNG